MSETSSPVNERLKSPSPLMQVMMIVGLLVPCGVGLGAGLKSGSLGLAVLTLAVTVYLCAAVFVHLIARRCQRSKNDVEQQQSDETPPAPSLAVVRITKTPSAVQTSSLITSPHPQAHLPPPPYDFIQEESYGPTGSYQTDDRGYNNSQDSTLPSYGEAVAASTTASSVQDNSSSTVFPSVEYLSHGNLSAIDQSYVRSSSSVQLSVIEAPPSYFARDNPLT
ncbi:uncharacterized protein LOC121876260 [Homarus americanus]|uniref:Transmembrane protein n=1 Tax=Homarus americanus TaxID=6706 RepID=A0A8J5JL75_HOMAM|nr:uncharacterized protein LOC121876260 [Homarus americanus]KAG7160407.1 hypothetical protein Hamer_G001647 [Homarus americanus]